jgi:hypothetical protein
MALFVEGDVLKPDSAPAALALFLAAGEEFLGASTAHETVTGTHLAERRAHDGAGLLGAVFGDGTATIQDGSVRVGSQHNITPPRESSVSDGVIISLVIVEHERASHAGNAQEKQEPGIDHGRTAHRPAVGFPEFEALLDVVAPREFNFALTQAFLELLGRGVGGHVGDKVITVSDLNRDHRGISVIKRRLGGRSNPGIKRRVRVNDGGNDDSLFVFCVVDRSSHRNIFSGHFFVL